MLQCCGLVSCPAVASKQVGCHLGRQLAGVEQQFANAKTVLAQMEVEGKPTSAQHEKIAQLQCQYYRVESTQVADHQQLQQLSLSVHPFATGGSGFQTTTQVIALLQHQLTLCLRAFGWVLGSPTL